MLNRSILVVELDCGGGGGGEGSGGATLKPLLPSTRPFSNAANPLLAGPDEK